MKSQAMEQTFCDTVENKIEQLTKLHQNTGVIQFLILPDTRTLEDHGLLSILPYLCGRVVLSSIARSR